MKHITLEKLLQIVQLVSGGLGDVGLAVIETEYNKLPNRVKK